MGEKNPGETNFDETVAGSFFRRQEGRLTSDLVC